MWEERWRHAGHTGYLGEGEKDTGYEIAMGHLHPEDYRWERRGQWSKSDAPIATRHFHALLVYIQTV